MSSRHIRLGSEVRRPAKPWWWRGVGGGGVHWSQDPFDPGGGPRVHLHAQERGMAVGRSRMRLWKVPIGREGTCRYIRAGEAGASRAPWAGSTIRPLGSSRSVLSVQLSCIVLRWGVQGAGLPVHKSVSEHCGLG